MAQWGMQSEWGGDLVERNNLRPKAAQLPKPVTIGS
jgi:hypothetical protein